MAGVVVALVGVVAGVVSLIFRSAGAAGIAWSITALTLVVLQLSTPPATH
ncbi:hypothetical protein [Motilibacter peucedani]|nr:hypothetical protein [Motilibacter peucedani]